MEMKDLIAVVEKWAPTLASHLVGPFGGIVLEILSALYGTSNKFDFQGLADKIVEDPYRLKDLEIKHREKVGDQLVGLLDLIESRASNGLLWLSGIVIGMAFLFYVLFEITCHG